ncbi:hypothetical protein [Anatilimnocola floriformis]|uniref:hypothetical protein n=1 Tax=Anatilimnocola floriformis TaxID=2948575 RepID=UPI0020C3DC4B|nr:hypothetical protein [Anatilimnocola floriformis]
MKLSLRDLFWLTLIVAIGLSWRLQHSRIVAAFAGKFFGALQSADFEPSLSDIDDRQRELAALETLRESELIARVPYYQHEMVRRRMSGELQEMYDHLRKHARRNRAAPNAAPVWDNRHMLTAWRRSAGMPDPIEIEVASIGRDRKGRPVAGPVILPRIKNVDAEGEPFYLETKGVIPAAACWRVQLFDAQGQRVPGVDIGAFKPTAGPIGGEMLLDHQSRVCDVLLDAREYVKSPPPGRYTLVLFHASRAITNEDDLVGRISWKSKPIPVIVENLALTSKWQLIVLPLSLFLITLLISLVLFVQQTFRRNSARRLKVRDWLALVLIVLLTAAWGIDIFLLKQTLDQQQSNAASSWTMRLL